MKKIAKAISMLCCMTLLISMIANAAELAAVMNAYTCSDSVVLFVKDQGREIDNVYLGNDEAQEFKKEDGGPVRTVVVLDNSLSINKKYREGIKAFLTDLAAARGDGDTFTIATFAENLTYLVQDSGDYLEIKAQIDGLQFENQDSYFTNVMYTVMNDISKYEDIKYTRVIVIADGVDNEALGYTDDELNKKIQAIRVPIYSVGCTSKGNEENLKKMFALSRLSNGKSYLLDDVSGTQILQDIGADSQAVKITVIPQDKSCDGSVRPVRIAFGEDYAAAEVAMPFKAAEETTAEETATEAETQPETTAPTEAATEPETEPAEEEGGIPVVLFGILGVLAVVIAAAIIVLVKKKKPREQETSIDLSGIGHSRDTVITGNQGNRAAGTGGTEILNRGSQSGSGGGSETNILRANNAIKLVLQDMDNPSKTFEYPLRDKILIGRDASRCQIAIDYSTYVSGIHCEVVSRGGSLFVRDGGGDVIASTNGTFVNDKRVAPELPLPSGSILKLGQVRLKVSYK